MTASISCPRCGSVNIVTRNYGRKVGGILGAIAGAVGSFVAAREVVQAEVPAVVDHSPDLASTGFAGTVVTTLLGAAAGCTTGAGVGSTLDEAVFDNLSCNDCGNTFSKSPT